MKNTLNNFFVAYEDAPITAGEGLVNFVNKALRKVKVPYHLTPWGDPAKNMNSLEQRINFYHLISNVVDNNVEGDLVELGCYLGQSASLFQQVLNFKGSSKKLHLYDSFEMNFTDADVISQLLRNFDKKGLQHPVIHKGWFNETIPEQFPPKIAFAHVDCGVNLSTDAEVVHHKSIMMFCLQHLYDHLAKGGICVLMDYHDPNMLPGNGISPAVKLACDEFFVDKPEELVCLYGGGAVHAYFKKL